MSEPARERLAAPVLQQIRSEIRRTGGQEVLFVGHLDSDGFVTDVEVFARGNDGMVAAPLSMCERGDVVIHNHPGGRLRPSEADVMTAARLAEAGVGSMIVDNEVENVYVLVEPPPPVETTPLDIDRLAAAIDDGGAMAAMIAGFRPRESQIAMLRAAALAFNQDRIMLAEAGTGVGKSFAYLIPAVAWAATNGERVVIATATINLQEQLLHRDVVAVQRALGTDEQVALVKGRGNYLCGRRLSEARDEASLFPEDEQVSAIVAWADSTNTGSRSDLPFHVPDRTWSRLASDADTCAIARCPNRDRCFVLRARQQAAGARILVANHHLVFSDLAIRRAGAGWDTTAILPPFSRLVFDEAHNLERAATSFFSETVSPFAVRKHAARLLRTRGAHRFGLLDRLAAFAGPAAATVPIERSLEAMRERTNAADAALAAFLGEEGSWRLTAATREPLRTACGVALNEAQQAILAVADGVWRLLQSVPEEDRETSEVLEAVALVRRLEAIAAVYGQFSEARVEEEDEILWMERRGAATDRVVALIRTPLEVSGLMQETVFEPHRTVVMTSATLTVNESFSFWGSRLGVPFAADEVDAARFPSPFDYARRVVLAVPNDAPAPDSPHAHGYLRELIERLVGASGGGALVLFTSYRQLDAIYEEIHGTLESRGFSCYRQGTRDRSRLLDSFRTDVSSVLFATDSFWEGIDVPGSALRLVILCRLPFRVPTDPVQLARSEAIERRGGNPFAELSLPQAAMRLKQGFGRLMRRVEDYGAVVIADPRMVTRSYSRVLWNSLPPARPIVASGFDVVEEVGTFLRRMEAEAEG